MLAGERGLVLLMAKPTLSLRRSLGFELDELVLTFRLRCLRTEAFSSFVLSLERGVPVVLDTRDPVWSISNSSEVRFLAFRVDWLKALGGEVERPASRIAVRSDTREAIGV